MSQQTTETTGETHFAEPHFDAAIETEAHAPQNGVRTDPDFYMTNRGAEDLIGVLPGYAQRGDLLYHKLKLATPNHDLVVADYSQAKFDVDAVCDGLIKIFKNSRARRLHLYGSSFGGVVTRHVMEQSADAGLEFDEVRLDAAPFTWADVQPNCRWLAYLTQRVKNSRQADRLYQCFMPNDTYGIRGYYSIRQAAEFVSWAHKTKHPQSIADIHNFFAYHQSEGNDGTVKTEDARQHHAEALGRHLEPTHDDRPIDAHTGDPVVIVQHFGKKAA